MSVQTQQVKYFRDSASFGKRQEYIAVAEMLKRGFDVYMTLVDDQQIDCILRVGRAMPKYVDVQIKARSSSAKYPCFFADLQIQKPRSNYVFVFYSEKAECYWVVPSTDLSKISQKSSKADGTVCYNIKFGAVLKNGDVKIYPKFEKYRDNFNLLKGKHAKEN